jgi:ABC-type Zn uptake system ZnuABC Zn-binding protein ZnuA
MFELHSFGVITYQVQSSTHFYVANLKTGKAIKNARVIIYSGLEDNNEKIIHSFLDVIDISGGDFKLFLLK